MSRKFKNATSNFMVTEERQMFDPLANNYRGSCPGGSYTFVDDLTQARELLNRRCKLPVAVDIETSGLDPFSDCIHLMSLSFSSLTAFVLDIRQLMYDDPGIREQIQRFLICNSFVIHNSLFEQVFFKARFGVFANVVSDTQVMNEIATAGLPERSGLGEVTKHYLGYEVDKLWQKGFANLHPGSMFPDDAVAYAAGDVTRLLQLAFILESRLRDQGLWEVWDQIEKPLLPITAEAKYRGIEIDTEVLQVLRQDLLYQLAGHESDFSRLYPGTNPNSSQQITELMVNLGNKVENSDEECLKKIIASGSRASKNIASTVLDYRGVKKLLSTYVEPLQGKHLNPVTKRLHPSWRQCGTDTGRMACREPNVQNIPSEGVGAKIRDGFIAGEGNKFVIADYSQFELRVLASLSKEPLMVEAFRYGKDLHSQTAELLFGSEFTKEQRKLAKIFNFAIAYGAGPGALAFQTGIKINVAQELYEKYFKSYMVLSSYLKRSAQHAKDYGESSSPFGRKRYYLRPNPDDEGFRWKMEAIGRAGVNHPIQSCNGDSIKIASTKIAERLVQLQSNAFICLFVHDELVLQCRERDAELLAGIVEFEMVQAAEKFVKEVPITVVTVISDRWEK